VTTAGTDAAEVSRALREVTRAAAAVDHALTRALHLRPLDYAALGHVMSAVPPLGPAELGGRLGISSGSATELVDRLEHAGHVRRERHPGDRRRIGLHATESAVGEVLGALGPLVAGLTEVAEALTAAERSVVAAYLRDVAERMQAFADDH
jgi:DNA-binding MarR family transcriptional regulator